MEYLVGFLIIQEFIFEFSSLLPSVKEKVWQSDNFVSDSKGSCLFEVRLVLEKHMDCLSSFDCNLQSLK